MVGGAVNEAIHVEERLMILKWNEKQIHRYEFINNHTVLSVADFIYFDRYAVILSKFQESVIETTELQLELLIHL